MLFKDWATKHRWTAAGIGRQLGVSTSTVTRWLSGEVIPSPDNIAAVAKLTEGAVGFDDMMSARKLFVAKEG